ncbi:MAG: glycosyltransferase family 2 protein [Deltaproteobacteria bacterium]|nr:glycosyltransferase family 2 protein [Deltaproteobacteria bacterium]
MSPELTVVVPAYNEEACIREVLLGWIKELKKRHINFQIIVLNDGSQDQTGKILSSMSVEFPEIVFINKSNAGHGPTILMGYQKASRESPWIFQIDSDNDMGPESFYRFWGERESFDFLLGRREQRRQPLSRKIISWASRWVIRVFYGFRVWDVNSPYRLFRTDVFKDILSRIPEGTFAPNLILSGFCSLKKLRVLEVPVPHADRKKGGASMNTGKLFKASLQGFFQTIIFRTRMR